MNIANKQTTALCILALGGLFSATCSALQIDITGKVVASPCIVNGGDDSLDVNLGDNIQADDLGTAGNATNWKTFTLALTNCPASTTSFSVAFAGTADANDPNSYENTGTATNLKLELTDQTGNTTYSNGTSLENVVIPTDTRAYNLLLRTRAVSKGLVMPGTIKGQVQATFTYQ